MPPIIAALAGKSANPALFLWGMGLIYLSAFILLASVFFKFHEHAGRPRELAVCRKHPVSTLAMAACVAALFPFWLHSRGQIAPLEPQFQALYFGIGAFMLVFGLLWHVRAKKDIGLFWSDNIEIKSGHAVVTHGAYALARHPMYASLLMWCWGASLMMQNWITLALAACIFWPLMIIRARAEEKMLLAADPEYRLYQENVRMLFPKLSGACAMIVRIAALALFLYCIVTGVTWRSMLLLFFVYSYLGRSIFPEKAAFAYSVKAFFMTLVWAASLVWPPVYFFLYFIFATFLYGLRWDCPCMKVYEKYGGCPCAKHLKKCWTKR